MTSTTNRARREHDPLLAVLLATTVGYFVLLRMAYLDNWLEVVLVTAPTWILLAISRREFEVRRSELRA